MTKIGVIVATRKLEVKCIFKVVYIFSKRIRGRVNIDPFAPPGRDFNNKNTILVTLQASTYFKIKLAFITNQRKN